MGKSIVKETCIDKIDIIPRKHEVVNRPSKSKAKPVEVSKETNIDDSSSDDGKQFQKSLKDSSLSPGDGPIGTSSPKIGRAAHATSKESPFKSYPKKLGKSEQTLLDIMPLNSKQPKPISNAKSQEGIEDWDSSDDRRP